LQFPPFELNVDLVHSLADRWLPSIWLVDVDIHQSDKALLSTKAPRNTIFFTMKVHKQQM
jgi:hypothetical protein